jgi:hypothetical protein
LSDNSTAHVLTNQQNKRPAFNTQLETRRLSLVSPEGLKMRVERFEFTPAFAGQAPDILFDPSQFDRSEARKLGKPIADMPVATLD